MRGINKVILIGHLGKDPEVRYLEGGSVVANIRMATSESYTNKSGERVDQTEWHSVVFWRKLAEIAEKYLRKGSLIYVEGKLQTRSWEDKEGNKRYTTEIVGDSMTMLDKKGDVSDSNIPMATENEPNEPVKKESTDEVADSKPTDDLPF